MVYNTYLSRSVIADNFVVVNVDRQMDRDRQLISISLFSGNYNVLNRNSYSFQYNFSRMYDRDVRQMCFECPFYCLSNTSVSFQFLANKNVYEHIGLTW